MTVQLIEERWKRFEKWSLKSGKHNPDSTFCVMEAVAYVAGEEWSDHPACACPVITAFMVSWNDGLPTDADRDRLLKPLIPLLINTRDKKLEAKRATMAADWYVRVQLPAWLRLAGLTRQADYLASFPEITSFAKTPSIQAALESVAEDAEAAWSAAWSAAESAAWSAAESAARSAARSAAWSAAEKQLATTVTELQQSALELVKRMIAA